jgi:hypothetical protein
MRRLFFLLLEPFSFCCAYSRLNALLCQLRARRVSLMDSPVVVDSLVRLVGQEALGRPHWGLVRPLRILESFDLCCKRLRQALDEIREVLREVVPVRLTQ